MDKYSPSFDLKTVRPIVPKATRNNLWARSSIGRRVIVKIHSMLPTFKITPEALNSLWTCKPRTGVTGAFLGSKSSPLHFLSVEITECSWGARMTPRNVSDCSIKILPKPKLLNISHHDLEFILQSVLYKLDSYAELEHVEPLDLCKPLVTYNVSGTRVLLKCSLVFPSVPLQFSPIAPISIVSTPLTVHLTKKEKKVFRTGYLTMDQKRRVLPLVLTDPLVFRYPLVGVWAAGLPNENKKYPFTHPLVWAAFVRFIESGMISDRISPEPEKHCFLFVYFAEKPLFYEVSTQEEPCWAVASIYKDIHKGEGVNCAFLKENVGGAHEKPPLPFSQLCNSNEERPVQEKMIKKQARVLRDLQQQITDLQDQLSRNSPVPRLKKTQSETRLKNPKEQEKRRNSLVKKSIKPLQLQLNRKDSFSPKLSTRSLPSPLRYSLNNEDSNAKQFNREATYIVPRIEYDSPSDTSDDELVKQVQMRYCKSNRKFD